MKRIVISTGEPAGIGPDLVLQLLHDRDSLLAQCPVLADNALVILADPVMLQARARQLACPIDLPFYDAYKVQQFAILPIDCAQPVVARQLAVENADYVLAMLTRATQGCLSGEFAAMVTAPVHKGIINDAGIAFSGHTEFLAELTHAPLPVMMLATEHLRVALATTHLPLANVSQAITQNSLKQVLRILNHDLQTKYRIAKPHILVCGLNPHAGENGYLGREEIDVIEPALNALRDEGLTLTGPLPADTLFTPRYLDGADAVLAMYHDQGLPVLKYAGFGQAINITLGLPIIRTSVDHGTALALAGTGKAETGSLLAAIKLATELA